MSEKLLKRIEVAELLGVTPRTLDTWRARGTVPQPVWISASTYRWRVSDIEAYLASLPQSGEGLA